MAVPTFVGAGGAVYNATTAWPTSLTLTTSDLPSGVTSADALVLFVTVFYSRRTFPTPVDDTLGSFSGLTGWSVVPRGRFSASFAAADLYYDLWAYVARRGAATFPLTISPLGATSGTSYTPINGGNYRAQILAWRPSRLLGNTDRGTANNSATTIPSSTSTPLVSTTSADAIAIAAACLPDVGTIGSIATANGFTERHHTSPITSPARGGSLKVADRAGGAVGPKWNKGSTFPDNPSGATVLFALDAFDPAAVSEWGVDRIAW